MKAHYRFALLPSLLLLQDTGPFSPHPTIMRPYFSALHSTSMDQDMTEWLDTVAHKLRLQVYDLDSGVYGFESKDPHYGIEVLRTTLHISEDNKLGLELTEVAHGRGDHRGLVLVSGVLNQNVVQTNPIHIGDTIVGVFVGDHFKESTTDIDYDETVDVLNRAKKYAHSVGGTTISL
jgi:hypothetical protein